MGYSPWGHKELDTTKRLKHTQDAQKVVSNGGQSQLLPEERG